MTDQSKLIISKHMLITNNKQYKLGYISKWNNFVSNNVGLPISSPNIKYWNNKTINSIIHKKRVKTNINTELIGQFGVFSKCIIPKNSIIGIYYGYDYNYHYFRQFKYNKHEKCHQNNLFSYYDRKNKERVIVPHPDNILQYINDGRLFNNKKIHLWSNYLNRNNVESNLLNESSSKYNLIFFVTMKKIASNNELLINYGNKYWYK